MATQRMGENVLSLMLLALGAWIIQHTYTVFAEAGATSDNALDNSALFPRIIAYALVILCGANIAGNLLRKAKKAAESSETTPKAPIQLHNLMREIITLLVIMVYLLVLKPIGYHIATPVMMASLFYILGAKWWEAGLFGVVVSVVVALFFEQGMNVILPVGIWSLDF